MGNATLHDVKRYRTARTNRAKLCLHVGVANRNHFDKTLKLNPINANSVPRSTIGRMIFLPHVSQHAFLANEKCMSEKISCRG